jgi:hypothetical protein
MNLWANRTRRLVKTITVSVAVAAMAVPVAQGKITPNGKYGPLDPWAYNAIQRSAPTVPFITEHSAGQNSGSHLNTSSVPLITEHSAGQNSMSQQLAISPSAAALAPNGFNWRDVGVGVAGGVSLALLAAAMLLAVRKRRGLAHIHS